MCKYFYNGVSRSFSNVMKRAEDPHWRTISNPNSNDRNVPGGIEATLGVLFLAPGRAETYRVIVVIVNNVATIMIIIIIIAKCK